MEHPSWRLWKVRDAELDCDVEAVYGAEFASALCGPPDSALLADGSEIVVRRGRRI